MEGKRYRAHVEFTEQEFADLEFSAQHAGMTVAAYLKKAGKEKVQKSLKQALKSANQELHVDKILWRSVRTERVLSQESDIGKE